MTGTTLWSSTLGDVLFTGLTPGAINSTTIGATTPSTGAFTTLGSTGLATLGSVKIDTGTKTATATGGTTGAATLNKNSGIITSPSLTTAAGATWVLTITNSAIAATDQVYAQLATTSAGTPIITNVVPGAGSVVITVTNIHATAALNNTVLISFLVVKA